MVALEYLLTKRLIMRPLCNSDWDDILTLHREERVIEPLIDGVPLSYSEIHYYLQYGEHAREAGLPGIMHTTDSETGMFAGVFTLTPIHGENNVDLGARLMPSSWGKGLAVEGGAALLAHAFDELCLDKITSLTGKKNRTVPFVLAQLGYDFISGEERHGSPAYRFCLTREKWIKHGNASLTRRKAMELYREYNLERN
jgi:[ribosomal protein S5]-alanine N-acetyltransferase